MKKIFFVPVLAGIISLLISCSALSADVKSEKKNNGVSKVTFALADSGAGSRTIMPNEMTLDDVVKVELTAERISSDSDSDEVLPDVEEAEGFIREWNSIKDFKSSYISLLYGKYDFTLVLKTAYSSVDSNEHVSQTAKLEGVEISKETTTLTFNTSYADNGCLLVTLYWPADSNGQGRFGVIKGSLVPYGKAEGTTGSDGTASDGTISSDGTSGTAVSEEDASGSDTDEGTFYDFDALTISPDDQVLYAPEKGYYYVQYMLNNVPNGKYYLYFKFYDTEDTECTNALNTITDIVYIHGFKTEEVIPLDVKEFNVYYNIDYDTALGSWAEGVFDNLVTRRNAYTAVTLPGADEISREGYIFKGWKVQKKAESDFGLVFEDETSDGKVSADGTTGVISTDDGAGVTGGTSGTSGADTTDQIITKIGVGRDTAMDYQLVAVWEEKAVPKIDAHLYVDPKNEIEVEITEPDFDYEKLVYKFEISSPEEYSDFVWTFDDAPLDYDSDYSCILSSSDTPEILELDASEWATGTYDISLSAKDENGSSRSFFVQIQEWTEMHRVCFINSETEEDLGFVWVKNGELVPESSIPKVEEKEGYLFAGWYDYDEKFDFTSPVKYTAFIHPVWIPETSGNMVVDNMMLNISIEHETLYLNHGSILFYAKKALKGKQDNDDSGNDLSWNTDVAWNAELYYGGNCVNDYGNHNFYKTVQATQIEDDDGYIESDVAKLVILGENDILETGGTYKLYVTATYEGVTSSAYFDVEIQNKEYFRYEIEETKTSPAEEQLLKVKLDAETLRSTGVFEISGSSLTETWYSALMSCFASAEYPIELDIRSYSVEGITSTQARMFYIPSTGSPITMNSLILPESINTIVEKTFSSATIRSITIPASVSRIEENAFESCSGLEEIIVDADNQYYESKCNNTVLVEKATNKILAFAKGTSKVTTLDFSQNGDLSSVTEIAANVFSYSGITKISDFGNVTKIGEKAFYSSKLESAESFAGITEIGKEAFMYSKLQSIDAFGSISVIPESAFYGSELTSIGSFGEVTEIGKNAFYGTKLAEITSFEKVRTIGECAFQNSELATIGSFGDVISIGDAAFKNTKITEIKDFGNVMSLGESAFSNCQSLTNVNLSGIKIIYKNAFYYCTNLKDVVLQDSIVGIGANAFASTKIGTADGTLSLPETGTWYNSFSTEDAWEETVEKYAENSAMPESFTGTLIEDKDDNGTTITVLTQIKSLLGSYVNGRENCLFRKTTE